MGIVVGTFNPTPIDFPEAVEFNSQILASSSDGVDRTFA